MLGLFSHLVEFFEPHEYRKCRMCMPIRREEKCEELSTISITNLIVQGNNMDHQNNWFETENDARKALEDFSCSLESLTQESAEIVHDPAKLKIQWDKITQTPYMQIKTEIITIYTHQKKTKQHLEASLSKVMKFPQYKSYNWKVISYRNSSRQAIRKALKSNDKGLVVKDAYIVKFPNLPIPNPKEVAGSSTTGNSNADNSNIKWVLSFEEASKAVKEFENLTCTKFISYNGHLKDIFKSPILFDENFIPYVVIRQKNLVCQHGKDYNKARNAKRRLPGTSSNNKLSNISKKVGCKAAITICETLKFPQHKVLPNMHISVAKTNIIKRAILENDKSVVKESMCCIKFPTVEDHSGHALVKDKFIANRNLIHPLLVERINQLVNNGVHTLDELKSNIDSYIVNEFLEDRPDLRIVYQRFMPKNREIYNHAYIAYAKRHLLRISKDEVNHVSGGWNMVSQQSDNILFRPYDSAEQNLLFVHQFDWQKKLLQRFGATACLLESTCNPEDYTYPLFFLAAKSNRGYHLVGSFITQNRTSSGVEEAVQVFQEWSTDWDPTSLQINKSEEQIQAIEELITGCHVLTYGFDQLSNDIEREEIHDDVIVESWAFPPMGSSQTQHIKQQKENTRSRISNVLSEIAQTSLEVPSNRSLIEVELELKKVLEKIKNCCIRAKQTIVKRTYTSKKRKASLTNDETALKRNKKTSVEKHSPVSATPQPHQTLKFSYNLSMPPEVEIPVQVSAATQCYLPLNQALLQNGPQSLTFLHLKSLEPTMSNEEKSLLVSKDPDFKVGWLYDEVINSYLWSLSKGNEHVMYASSTVAQIMERKGSLKRLWQNVSLQNKKYIFIPWNPTGSHWVLLVVDITRKCLLYLDPQQMVQVEKNSAVIKAKHFVDHAIFTKFKFHIRFVESTPRSLQSDSASCGVYVCMYAKWLANNKTLTQSEDHENYRQTILDEIAGGCLNNILSNKEICKICNNDVQPNWIQCTRCQHWLHIECVGLTPEEANCYQYFVCP